MVAELALPFVSLNFGIAIATMMPMITTTIRSSIRVKPSLRRIGTRGRDTPGSVCALQDGNAGATTSPQGISRSVRTTYAIRPDPATGPLALSIRGDSRRMQGSAALRFQPVCPRAGLHEEGHRQLHRVLHLAFHERGDLVQLRLRHLEHQLVVHLEEHLGLPPAGGLRAVASGPQRPVDADHGDLDQVRGRALDGGVRGGPLAERPDVEVAVAELGNVAAAL